MAVRGITNEREEKGLLLSFWNAAYNFVSAFIQNDATAGGSGVSELADVVGQPVKDNSGVWEFVAAADIANAEGIIIDGPRIDLDNPPAANALTPFPYRVLVRGPAVLNKTAFPATDIYGDAIDADDFETAMSALDIVSLEGPELTVEQTS